MHGLNIQFIDHTQGFMDAHSGITSSQNLMGTRYTLDANHVGIFDLLIGSHNAPSLERFNPVVSIPLPFGRSVTRPRRKANPITAYYLASQANATKNINITNHANFFFTDTLTGCLFAAYGNDRFNLTVEHSNALTLGANHLQQRRTAIQNQNHPVEIFFGPDEYRAHPNMPAHADPMMMIATVVGRLTGNGWVFYGRVRDAGGAHNALGAHADVL